MKPLAARLALGLCVYCSSAIASTDTPPEIFSIGLLENTSTDSCMLSGNITLLIEYDLFGASQTELVVQFLDSTSVQLETTVYLSPADNEIVVDVPNVLCATELTYFLK